jgi:hypothetical protein
MTNRILDRLPQKDPASRAYGIAEVVPQVPTGSVWWTGGPVLDQGQQGHCGGFAAAGEAAASPVRVPGVDDAYGHAFYYEAKDRGLDPWGREDGTSTLAMMKVGQLRGLWDSYRWAFSLDDLKRNLVVGPFLLGVPWFTGMFEPTSDGIIRATGVEEGGHLVCVTGWSPNYAHRGPMFRIRQSWGKDHGKGGNVYLPEADMYRIHIQGQGEAGVPITRRLPR